MKNKIKNFLKKAGLWGAYCFFLENFMKLATIISPTLNVRLRYHYAFHKKINLNQPQTFIEKLNWLKLNESNKKEIYWRCADKLEVRKYVEGKNLSDILNPLIAVYDNIDEVKWETLPDKFALKMTDGCGCNYICNNKVNLDISSVKKLFKKWERNHEYLRYAELQNKPYFRKIVVEEFIGGGNTPPIDYKFYCFNGKAVAIYVVAERDKASEQRCIMSTSWEFLSWVEGHGDGFDPNANPDYELSDEIKKKPSKLKDMIAVAEKLSEDFYFVRVDLYQVENRIVFGELTFTCSGGIHTSETPKDKLDMGELLKIPV